MDERTVAERVGRVEALVDQVETLPDETARQAALELAQALLDLYGTALARIMTVADAPLAAALAADDLVGHLLLLHGLHPEDAAARITAALRRLRPHLRGAEAELVAVHGGTARLRLRPPHGGRVTAAQRTAVAEAVRDAAPELAEVTVETAAPAPVLIPLGGLRRAVPQDPGARTS